MRALVTGGGGFLGSHLIDALVGRDDDVFVVDDLSSGNGANLERAINGGAIAIPADVTDLGALDHVLEPTHRRSSSTWPRRRIRASPSVTRASRRGSTSRERPTCSSSLAAMAPGRSYLASSAEVYGECGGEDGPIPAAESTTYPRPLGPHGASKLAAERYAALYRERSGLRTVSLRLANVFGPRQRPIRGGAIVASICRALSMGGPVELCGDGSQVRDFVFVTDAVTALLAAADGESRGEINVGSGVPTSVADLVEVLAELAGTTELSDDVGAGAARRRKRRGPRSGARRARARLARHDAARRRPARGARRRDRSPPRQGPACASPSAGGKRVGRRDRAVGRRDRAVG